MNDRDLRRSLRELPAILPGDRFTEEVLDRLDGLDRPELAGDQAPESRRLLSLAASIVLAAAAGIFLASEWGPRTPAETETVRSLQQESEALREEIRRLENRLEAEDPLLYVGGTEEVDLVLDLSRWPAPEPSPQGIAPEGRLDRGGVL